MKFHKIHFKNIKTVLLVDFENICKFNPGDFDLTAAKVYILIGLQQRKMHIDQVMKIQPLGTIVEWIKLEKQGKNALDFQLSFLYSQLIGFPKLFNATVWFISLCYVVRYHN